VRGDTSGPNVMMTEPSHQEGFKFLRRSAIDQHIDALNRWDDLIPVIQKYPNLLGIGLSEGTAIVMTGDNLRCSASGKSRCTTQTTCTRSADHDDAEVTGRQRRRAELSDRDGLGQLRTDLEA
jgi:cyanophycinase-like exopeptidase